MVSLTVFNAPLLGMTWTCSDGKLLTQFRICLFVMSFTAAVASDMSCAYGRMKEERGSLCNMVVDFHLQAWN